MTSFTNTLEAVKELADTGTKPDISSPNYQLLESLYSRPPRLLPNPIKAQRELPDLLFEKIKLDFRLNMLNRWFGIPLITRDPLYNPDSEIPALKPLLAEILDSPELETPELHKLAKQLKAYLESHVQSDN